MDDVPPIISSSDGLDLIENAFGSNKPEANCFAAILMGLKCGQNPNIKPIPMSDVTQIGDVTQMSIMDDVISTAQSGLELDRDEMGAKPMIVSSGGAMTPLINTVQVWPQKSPPLLKKSK